MPTHQRREGVFFLPSDKAIQKLLIGYCIISWAGCQMEKLIKKAEARTRHDRGSRVNNESPVLS